MPRTLIFRHPPGHVADAVDAVLQDVLKEGGNNASFSYRRAPTGVFPQITDREAVLVGSDVSVIYLLPRLDHLPFTVARIFQAMGSPTIPVGYTLAETLELVLVSNIPAIADDATAFASQPGVVCLTEDDLNSSPLGALQNVLAACNIPHSRDRLAQSLAEHQLVELLEKDLSDAPPADDNPLSQAGFGELFRRLSGQAQLKLGKSLDAFGHAPSPVERGMSFFTSTRRPYYISAPDFRHNSAGIRCLHYLCHALNELGEEAYVTPAQTFNPALRTPPLTLDVVKRHFQSGRRPVAVYPEVIAGDPMEAGLVARWLLNRPGHLGGDTASPTDTRTYHYARWCLPEGVSSDILHIPTVDTRIFNNRDNPQDAQRSGACYYANKYLGHGGEVPADIRQSANSLGQEIPRTPVELAETLRQAKALYCFESTSLIAEALACGCPVLIVPSSYWEAHGDREILTVPGVAMADAPDALNLASAALRNHQKASDPQIHYYWWQIERFVAQTQEMQPRDGLASSLWALPLSERNAALPALEQQFRLLLPQDSSPQHLNGPAISPELPDELACLSAAGQVAPAAEIDFYILVTALNKQLLDYTLASLPSPLPDFLKIHAIATPEGGEGPADPRLTWHSSANPAETLNQLVSQSSAPWCTLCRAGDRLAPGAFAYLSQQLAGQATRLVHTSDEDALDTDGRPTLPILHGEMDSDLLRAGRSEFGLLTVRREAWVICGGWQEDILGLDYYGLVLRLLEICHEAGFGHIPRRLIRRHRNNAALLPASPAVQARRLQLLDAHLQRSSPGAQAQPGMLPTTANVRYPLTGTPLVSVLLPSADNPVQLAAFLHTLDSHTRWPALELILIDNGSQPVDQAWLQKQLPGRRIEYIAHPHPGNLAAMYNLGAEAARGDYLLLVHDDIECLHEGWLDELLAQCQRPDVWAVGGRLLDINGKIVEAGIIPMQAGLQPPPFYGQAAEASEIVPRPQMARQVSAISSACLMLRRQHWHQLGGMDAARFPRQMADIDLCLRIRKAGGKVLWTPFATLLHDSDHSTRGDRQGNKALLARWGVQLTEDPCLSKAMALDSSTFGAETEAAFMPDLAGQTTLPRIYCAISGAPAQVQRQMQLSLNATNRLGLTLARIGPVFPMPVLLSRLRTDVFICPSRLDERQLRELADYRQLTGCTVVINIDDRIDASAGEFDFSEDLLRLVGIAQRFTTTSPHLHRALASTPLGKHLLLLPEGIDGTQYPPPPPATPHRRPRIGWSGEARDIESIAATVIEMSGEVDWVFIGAVPEFLSACSGERHQAVADDKLAAKLASLDLDLAIVPLAGDRSQHYRPLSPLLAWGAAGIPVITSPRQPCPDDLKIIRLNDDLNQTWSSAIRNSIHSAESRTAQARAFREQVLAEYDLSCFAPQLLAAWAPIGVPAGDQPR